MTFLVKYEAMRSMRLSLETANQASEPVHM